MDDLYRISIIDKDKSEIAALERVFDRPELGFTISEKVCDALEYISGLENDMPDAIITGINLPQITGIDFISYLRQLGYDDPVIIASECAEFSCAQAAIELGVLAYCLKPVSREKAEEVLLKLKAKLEKKALLLEYEKLYYESDTEIRDKGFEGLLDYMEKHYNKRLLLTELAPKFYINPNYCCALFNKYKGMTFSQYLTKMRIEKAKYFLSKTALPIKRISLMVGFNDYFYFNKVFKKIENLTPSEYRKAVKESSAGSFAKLK